MPPSTLDAPLIVNHLLDEAIRRRASDLHIEPLAGGCEARLRIDGLLETIARYDADAGRSLVGRLMVMAQLLTYRLDIPQEGRIRITPASAPKGLELRLAVIPTTHGIRAAVRLPAELLQPRRLEELHLPGQVLDGLLHFARTDAGMLIVCGPAGSGKTTTIYALLEKIVELSPGLSIISLEDPVERDIPGVTQIEVSPFGELTYEKSLRSILRQDPQVLMLGEIRDAATASLAIQAALSGHRLICTLHAATPAGAIARLFEMGIEPYQITSALFAVVALRLLRRLAPSGPAAPASTAPSPYAGRVPISEMVRLDAPLRELILSRADLASLQKAYESRPGHVTIRSVAGALVNQGVTDAAEVERVLGGL